VLPSAHQKSQFSWATATETMDAVMAAHHSHNDPIWCARAALYITPPGATAMSVRDPQEAMKIWIDDHVGGLLENLKLQKESINHSIDLQKKNINHSIDGNIIEVNEQRVRLRQYVDYVSNHLAPAAGPESDDSMSGSDGMSSDESSDDDSGGPTQVVRQASP